MHGLGFFDSYTYQKINDEEEIGGCLCLVLHHVTATSYLYYSQWLKGESVENEI